MATDFWCSTHFKRWIVDCVTLQQARAEDLQYVDDPDHLALLGVFFANLMSKLGSKLNLKQRVIATATIFFRRFYLKNSYCETDPYLVLAACCYVASKAEESPIHIKNVVAEARNVFSEYGIRNFPSDNTKLAEMEFYLVDDLECDLVVFHPYRTLLTLVKDSGSPGQSEANPEREAGEVGAGIDDGQRFWGTGEGKLEMHIGGIQNAWFLINDTYRSDICLLYPPHLLAIAALYLICILNPSVRQAHIEWMELRQAALAAAASAPPSQSGSTRRSLRSSSGSMSSQKHPTTAQLDTSASSRKRFLPAQDFVGFFAGLNVNMRLVATIAQEMISFYALCDRLKEDFNPASSATHGASAWQQKLNLGAASRSASRTSSMTPGEMSVSGEDGSKGSTSGSGSGGAGSTGFDVDSMFLVRLLNKMRALRSVQAGSARAAPVNRALERTQAVG